MVKRMKLGGRHNCWFGEVARGLGNPSESYTARYRHKGRRRLKREKQLRVCLKSIGCPSAIDLHRNTDYRYMVFV